MQEEEKNAQEKTTKALEEMEENMRQQRVDYMTESKEEDSVPSNTPNVSNDPAEKGDGQASEDEDA